MPKGGLSAKEWRQRLTGYAMGIFKFSTGQRPRKNSHWDKELTKIESCSRHKNPQSVSLFGQKVLCACGYHVQQSVSTNAYVHIFSHLATVYSLISMLMCVSFITVQ